jgi:hypothetical protein
MSVLNKIAYFQKRRDEVPNQKLARALAQSRDKKGVREIADNLWNDNPSVQSDCLKVLYEIGYLEPALIAGYAEDFLRLLHSRNNRLVWGGMIALSTIAGTQARELYPRASEIMKAVDQGSVITQDSGVKALALIASAGRAQQREIFPYLLRHLATCRPKDVAQRAEKVLAAVTAANKADFIQTLERRLGHLSGAQVARVKRVIKEASAR